MQFDKEELSKSFSLPREALNAIEAGPKAQAGNRIELRVNGATVTMLNTECAVAADYVGFLGSVVKALNNSDALEAEANKCGRTIATGFKGIGSVPLESVGVPEVPDK